MPVVMGGKKMGGGAKPGLHLKGDTVDPAPSGAKRSEGKEHGHGMGKHGTKKIGKMRGKR